MNYPGAGPSARLNEFIRAGTVFIRAGPSTQLNGFIYVDHYVGSGIICYNLMSFCLLRCLYKPGAPAVLLLFYG